ncbi:hypothetical protein PDE_00709 [Penicillium oxalicum 114-2]|uniref:FAD-binding domain-containing protein n=1 Tax=Penicillium oxalicum (strain 114-2 / CGMCC 5302) TaxID=933388 RepID=S8AJ24_PENO1|nr:hypothetical protein PDE_00709 [Penicillium oxalicum 114-2]
MIKMKVPTQLKGKFAIFQGTRNITPLPTLIIGAGLGGICLAHALKKKNIPFKLFERDEKGLARDQGYRLRITQHGIDALKESLAPDLFTLFERTCAGAPTIGVRVKPDGSPIPAPSGFGPPARAQAQAYTVDRSVFREALLRKLEGDVFFGKSFERYSLHDDRVTATFADGTCEDGHLLIGADGVRSRVRKQRLPAFEGLDTGMRIIYGKMPMTPEFTKRLAEEYRQGMSLALDPQDPSQLCVLFESIYFPRAGEVASFKLPDPYMHWVLCIERSRLGGVGRNGWHATPQDSMAVSLKLTQFWNSSLRVIFEMQDPTQSAMRTILSAPPEIKPWEPSRRVTLLGDAIHVMPPTGAMGANTALRDAADLARRIAHVGGLGGVDGALIGNYEASLREFAKSAIELSFEGGRKSFGLGPVEQCKKILL